MLFSNQTSGCVTLQARNVRQLIDFIINDSQEHSLGAAEIATCLIRQIDAKSLIYEYIDLGLHCAFVYEPFELTRYRMQFFDERGRSLRVIESPKAKQINVRYIKKNQCVGSEFQSLLESHLCRYQGVEGLNPVTTKNTSKHRKLSS